MPEGPQKLQLVPLKTGEEGDVTGEFPAERGVLKLSECVINSKC